MQPTEMAPSPNDEKANNLKATFDILAYLQVDAKQDQNWELSERLEFAMNCAERQLSSIKNNPAVMTASP
jgi:hypothetical protein